MNGETLAAWAGVAVSLAIAIWSLLVARRSETRARSEREAREAALVSAWIASTFPLDGPVNKTRWTNAIVIRNASTAVVHDVEASAIMNGGDEIAFRAKVCPPGESFADWLHPSKRTSQRHPWRLLSSCSELPAAGRGMRPFTVSEKWQLTTLRFTDALGTRWTYEAGRGVRRA